MKYKQGMEEGNYDQKLIRSGEAHNKLDHQIWVQSDQCFVYKRTGTAQQIRGQEIAGIQRSITMSKSIQGSTIIRLMYPPSLKSISCMCFLESVSLQWRHNRYDGVLNQQPRNCLLDCLFRRRSKKTSKLRVTGFCGRNSLVTGEFPTQRASNMENVPIWWCHHVETVPLITGKEHYRNSTEHG